MAQGPAIPTFILRGHVAPVHALHFYGANKFLGSGDSEGWLVIWSTSSKRALAAWKAHESGIMAIKTWDDDKLISHGRDHKLRVWQVRAQDLAGLDNNLPVDGGAPHDQRQPWLVHSLSVNALNFCAFAICDETPSPGQNASSRPQLIATPNGLDSGGIDIFQLPSEHRISQLKSDREIQTNMVMAVALFHGPHADGLVLIAGYEDGHIMVHYSPGNVGTGIQWQRILANKPHGQPVLSLDVSISREYFISSGADANLAKFTLDFLRRDTDTDTTRESGKVVNTKHAGQQGLVVRSDSRIFATAGWDGRIRIYSAKTMKELAVLKWHRDGCFVVAFAQILQDIGAQATANSIDRGQLDDSDVHHSALDIIKKEREQKGQTTHWLAAGGKDGKISLWDIY